MSGVFPAGSEDGPVPAETPPGADEAAGIDARGSGRRRKSEAGERTCIVTRVAQPPERLIRFVLDPEGRVTPDIRHRLPGRGVWVTLSAEAIATAEKKKLFARAFKAPAIVEPGLAGRVEALLREAALAALSLARKSGSLTLGFTRIEGAIAEGKVAALIHAEEAGEDGVRKLDGAARRRGEGQPVPTFRLFSGEQLSLALARPNVIHAALLAGGAGDHGLQRIAALARFLLREPEDSGGVQPYSQGGAAPSAGQTTG